MGLANGLLSLSEEQMTSAGSAIIIERELRFYVPFEKLVSHVTLEALPTQLVEQHFFSKPAQSLLAVLVQHSTQNLTVPSGTRITQARIRRITSGETVACSLQLKGRLPSLAQEERIEFGVPIENELFHSLRDCADAGTVTKRRYFERGHVFAPDGNELAVRAEIDVALGSDGEPVRDLAGRQFVTVDVELDTAEHLMHLRAGRHTFGYLQHAVELTRIDKPLRKALSVQRLARKGLDKRATKVLDQLEEHLRSQSR
ncbi:MAG: hypothetical protein KDD44_02070 [Bdellovibrionales bacterium]|nr:hypothetical protein [Bdellovibrionales bacterium]